LIKISLIIIERAHEAHNNKALSALVPTMCIVALGSAGLRTDFSIYAVPGVDWSGAGEKPKRRRKRRKRRGK